MKVMIYGINYSPELTGIGKYTGEMAPWLACNGHQVKVITAPPYYPEWKVSDSYNNYCFSHEHVDGVEVTRCPLYVPKKPTAIKRLLHLISFSFTSFFAVFAKYKWRPDVVILVVPTLFCALTSLLFCKITGAKSFIHIQDYEVDALFGLGMIRQSQVGRFAFWIESFLLQRFDFVSTISPGMVAKAKDKGVDHSRIIFFPNWSEVSRFKTASPSREIIERLGIDFEKRIVLYSGNIGEKQGLDIVIDACNEMAHLDDIVFLIVGDGGAKSSLVNMAAEKGLNNIFFAPLQPYEDLPALLASADCHLVVQRRGAADAVLPSKLTNIFAVGGNAVITADIGTSLAGVCADFPGIAVRVEPESAVALAEGIVSALEMPKTNHVASRYAEKYLDKDRVLADCSSNI